MLCFLSGAVETVVYCPGLVIRLELYLWNQRTQSSVPLADRPTECWLNSPFTGLLRPRQAVFFCDGLMLITYLATFPEGMFFYLFFFFSLHHAGNAVELGVSSRAKQLGM